MSRALATFGALLLLAAADTVSLAQPRVDPFVVGVLRRDGLIIPFASFDGRRWESAWPVNYRYLELPISVADIDRGWWGRSVPPPSKMTVWTDGKAGGELTLVAPAFVNVKCGRRMGLRSNYHPAELPPPPNEHPFPKDGLVVSGTQTVGAIETIAKDSPEAVRVAAAIISEFNDAEDAAARAFTDWQHPFSKQQRRTRSIAIEALYRAPMDDAGWTAYYVEAVREYPPGPLDRGCGLRTVARGWVGIGPTDKQHYVELGAQVTYCDRFGATFMLPLGLIRAAGGTYWIYQLAGYESESYLIAKPTRKGIDRLVGYPVSACPF
jgi:hypothetical protein